MTPDHKQAVLLSSAAALQLNSITSEIEAAVLRGDTAMLDALREKAHAVLDAKIDHHLAAARAARAALGV